MYSTLVVLFAICFYFHIFAEAFNESAAKGKQMVIGGTKSKASSQSGYFETTFNRVLQVKTLSVYTCIHVYPV